jgi:hypothetical protein
MTGNTSQSRIKELLAKKKDKFAKENSKSLSKKSVPTASRNPSGSSAKPKEIEKKPSALSKMQQKMQKKLAGSKFRWINEQLYTTESQNSFQMFQQQPELFEIYHKGFATQVEQWPVNPVDIFIKELESMPKKTVICDMGCGEAKIGQVLKKRFQISSFDLVAANEFITACDIANVPLENESVDIVIFCLSLMGTNFADFLKEARRIIKKKFYWLM